MNLSGDEPRCHICASVLIPGKGHKESEVRQAERLWEAMLAVAQGVYSDSDGAEHRDEKVCAEYILRNAQALVEAWESVSDEDPSTEI